MFPIPPIEPYNGPILTGLVFTLTSAIPGKPVHTLTILGQTAELFNRAFITGTWNAKSFTGIIMGNNVGPLSISINWSKIVGTPTDHMLDGSVTFFPGHPVGKVLVLPFWFLQGTVTVSGDATGDGPAPVSGTAEALLFP